MQFYWIQGKHTSTIESNTEVIGMEGSLAVKIKNEDFFPLQIINNDHEVRKKYYKRYFCSF